MPVHCQTIGGNHRRLHIGPLCRLPQASNPDVGRRRRRGPSQQIGPKSRDGCGPRRGKVLKADTGRSHKNTLRSTSCRKSQSLPSPRFMINHLDFCRQTRTNNRLICDILRPGRSSTRGWRGTRNDTSNPQASNNQVQRMLSGLAALNPTLRHGRCTTCNERLARSNTHTHDAPCKVAINTNNNHEDDGDVNGVTERDASNLIKHMALAGDTIDVRSCTIRRRDRVAEHPLINAMEKGDRTLLHSADVFTVRLRRAAAHASCAPLARAAHAHAHACRPPASAWRWRAP